MSPINTTQLKQEQLVKLAIEKIPHRNARLFQDFLPNGYRQFSIDKVEEKHKELVQLAKLQLGIFITYVDDYSDNPKLIDSDFINSIFSLANQTEMKSTKHHFAFDLKQDLFHTIELLPNYNSLKSIFSFDFEQLAQAFRYSLLLQDIPQLNNSKENRTYLSHNMGIVLALMIDLMAVENIKLYEMGEIRKFFFEMQEISRIMNVLMSFEREKKEFDPTSELLFQIESANDLRINQMNLQKEKEIKLLNLKNNLPNISSFDSSKLFENFLKINELHNSFTGVL